MPHFDQMQIGEKQRVPQKHPGDLADQDSEKAESTGKLAGSSLNCATG